MTPPEGYALVDTITERIQSGDLVYDIEDEEWLAPSRSQQGEYTSNPLARPIPVRGRKRIMRSRRTTK